MGFKTDSTLGGISNTERAAKTELPPATGLTTKQREAYMLVQDWLKRNPDWVKPDGDVKHGGYTRAFKALGWTESDSYHFWKAKKRMEDRGSFTKGDFIRPGDAIVRNVARQQADEEDASSTRAFVRQQIEKAEKKALELAQRAEAQDYAAAEPGVAVYVAEEPQLEGDAPGGDEQPRLDRDSLHSILAELDGYEREAQRRILRAVIAMLELETEV